MASDFDAYGDDDYNDFDGDGLRWMSIMVVLLVIFGFFSLAWYAYQMSSEQMSDEEVVLITADESEFREAPEDPGGMNIPHQDKTVYETVTTMDSEDDTQRITSPSEEVPLVTRELGGAAEWIKGRGEPTSAEAKLEVLEKAVASVQRDEDAEQKNISAFIKQQEKEVLGAVDELAELPAPIIAYEPVTKNPLVETVKPKPVAKPRPKAAPKKKAAAAAKYRVQLAALKSQAEADKTWSRMKKSSSLLIGKSHVVNKVKVKGTTYYRLRVGAYQTRASANAFCSKLKAAKISCLVN